MQFNPGGGPMTHPIGAPQPVNPVLALLQRMGISQGKIHGFGHAGTPGQYGEATPSPQSGFTEPLSPFLSGPRFPLHDEAAPSGNPTEHLHALMAVLGRHGESMGPGPHSNFLEGLPPGAHGALLKLIARLNGGPVRHPVGVPHTSYPSFTAE